MNKRTDTVNVDGSRYVQRGVMPKWPLLFLTVSVTLLAADQAWKDKQVPEWTESDAKQLLTDSPWAKSVTPTLEKATENKPSRSEGGMRRGGGLGIGGIGIGTGGMGRRGSTGGDGNPSGVSDSRSGTNQRSSTNSSQTAPTLTLRWESALPIREAELKARDISAPSLDEDFYALALYGIPSRMVNDDSKQLADQFKNQAAIKRYGKKDLKPSRVEILLREDGPVIVYLFPRTAEITWRDHRIEFDAVVGRLKFTQPFDADEMMFHGKLEL
jgi:hypothetical protein